MASLKAYLAEKYMSGPKADAILAREAPRKKKRKYADSSSSAVAGSSSLVVDDDAMAWKAPDANIDEEEAPEFVEEVKGFRKKQGGGWQTVREPSPPDEQPQLVLPDGKPLAPPSAPARARPRSPSPVIEAENLEQETVYRDATGRKIDLSVARVEKKRKAREEAEKKEKQMEWGKGVVQREEAERRRRELQEERQRDFARTADDREINSRMKEEDRWNDPAAAFLSRKKAGPKRPTYTGPPPPPNRFGIPPGHRWDGVDRGNGFEKKLFQRHNERQRGGLEAYEWSVDDM